MRITEDRVVNLSELSEIIESFKCSGCLALLRNGHQCKTCLNNYCATCAHDQFLVKGPMKIYC